MSSMFICSVLLASVCKLNPNFFLKILVYVLVSVFVLVFVLRTQISTFGGAGGRKRGWSSVRLIVRCQRTCIPVLSIIYRSPARCSVYTGDVVNAGQLLNVVVPIVVACQRRR